MGKDPEQPTVFSCSCCVVKACYLPSLSLSFLHRMESALSCTHCRVPGALWITDDGSPHAVAPLYHRRPAPTLESHVPSLLQVFQRRVDGSVDFFRDWVAYKQGFGSQLGEFWLGNDNIHALTAQGTYELRVDLVDFEGNRNFAKYSSFSVKGETEKYKLVLGSFVGGGAGDSLTGQNNQFFSTKDQDNDLSSSNCAVLYHGAWWYSECHVSNLNGLYLRGAHESYANGINWMTWKGYKYSYKVSEMKVRPT